MVSEAHCGIHREYIIGLIPVLGTWTDCEAYNMNTASNSCLYPFHNNIINSCHLTSILLPSPPL